MYLSEIVRGQVAPAVWWQVPDRLAPLPKNSETLNVRGGVYGRPLNTPGDRPVTILVISPSRADHSRLREIFQGTQWYLQEAHTFREALTALCNSRMPVILSERTLPDGNWKDILSQIAPLVDRPRLIVTSLHADHDLWQEVLAMGGCDVLPKPFEAGEVKRVLELANREWEAERAGRWAQVSGSPARE